MQEGQALSPRQVMLVPRQTVLVPPTRKEYRQCRHSVKGRQCQYPPARKDHRQCRCSVPGQQHCSPQLGRSAGNAGTQLQAGSVSTQTGSVSPAAGKECRQCKHSSQAGSTNPQARNSAENRGTHPQVVSASPPFHMPGRSTGSADTPPQADQNLSPSQAY